ncbi:sensor histidine kinase [Streptomyces sp. NPDC008343]|uniref:sensor histidine kinase n=1 Tax=Streptomyces sp. NPDC008343 TaxID=3364828 RepID=UPI0036EB6FF7
MRMQATLRLAGVVVLCGHLLVAPGLRHYTACVIISAAYGAWSLLLLASAWRGRFLHRPYASVLLADSVVLTSLLALSGSLTGPGSGPLVDDAFFFVALLAAFQLRPLTTAVTAAIVAGAFYTTVVSTTDFHWSRALVHALFMATIGGGCALLSWSHRRQLQLVSRLADHRSRLVAQLANAEQREREHLATVLHDGVLQSVLAARQDVEEAQAGTDREALDRAHRSLVEAARQLRAGVTELHPEVLKHAGLVRALDSLSEEIGRRAGFVVRFRPGPYAPGPHDDLLYAAARELLTNAAKHSGARSVVIGLSQTSTQTRLEVTDDGVGLAGHAAEHAVREGHIGLATYRVRVESAGGLLTVESGSPSGTRAVVVLPPHGSDGEPRGRSAQTGPGPA